MRKTAFLLTLFFAAYLSGRAETQEPSSGEDRASGEEKNAMLPVFPLIHAAPLGTVSWTPEWPIAVPPDAFAVKGKKPKAVALELSSGTYRCSWDEKGRLYEFPVPFEGSFVGVKLERDRHDRISALKTDGEIPVEIEFLTYADELPLTLRVKREDAYYFVVFMHRETEVVETWFDGGGEMTSVAKIEYSPHAGFSPPRIGKISLMHKGEDSFFHYDSWGNISGIDKGEEYTEVVYEGLDRPRYMKKRGDAGEDTAGTDAGEAGNPEELSFLWDEEGVLRGMKEGGGESGVEYRYEYLYDREGNWTTRRAVRMTRASGYLVPEEGETVKRTIEYE